MIWLYNFLWLLTSPVWLAVLFIKNARRKHKVDWKQLTGELPIQPRPDRKRIWFHAVSVGEVIAAKPILQRLKTKLPDHELFLTVTTGSGYETAERELTGIVDGLSFFPLDIARFQFVAMHKVQPSVVAVMETELWMNFLAMAKNFGATTLLVNGRISDRSFRRSKWIRWLMKGITRYLDRALMQTPEDASRIEAYGAKDVEVLGNSKFDQAAESNSKSAADWRKELGIGEDEFVLIVGSTRSEVEEEVVFSALQTVKTRDLRIIYAPRHLERAEFVAARAKAEGFDLGLRSKGETSKFLLLDTYGELSSLYAVADLAIIGGGFDTLGGQNLLQPLAHGVPVLHGPHMDNFREVTKLANERGAALSLPDASAMGKTIQLLMDNPEERRRMGDAARKLVQEHVGASERYASAIADEAKAFAEKNAAWLAKRASVQSNP